MLTFFDSNDNEEYDKAIIIENDLKYSYII